jgi:hypothetical protein
MKRTRTPSAPPTAPPTSQADEFLRWARVADSANVLPAVELAHLLDDLDAKFAHLPLLAEQSGGAR